MNAPVIAAVLAALVGLPATEQAQDPAALPRPAAYPANSRTKTANARSLLGVNVGGLAY